MNYFNTPDYVDYLKRNFEVEGWNADVSPDAYCKRPDNALILNYLEKLEFKPGQTLLEIGCGLGRLLALLESKYQIQASGVDVCRDAIQLAHERLPHARERIVCSSAENLPFSEGVFDRLLCWGVFDLTEQGEALAEMLRILKVGGKLLITGKNNFFESNDTEARIAEEKSREKRIPNHYTDYSAFRDLALANGARFEMEAFFARRGDFANNTPLPVKEAPSRFYEYCAILTKESAVLKSVKPIATLYSRSESA